MGAILQIISEIQNAF